MTAVWLLWLALGLFALGVVVLIWIAAVQPRQTIPHRRRKNVVVNVERRKQRRAP